MKYCYSPGACSLAGHIVAAEGGLALDLEKVDLKSHITASGADFKQIKPQGLCAGPGIGGWFSADRE